VANLFVRAPVARGAGLKALDKRLAYRQVRQQAERMLRQGGLSRKVRQTLQKALRELNGDAVQPL
jgi:GAF domain-containing protein